MKAAVVKITLFVFILTLASSLFAAGTGNYRIPQRVEFAGKTIDPGTYGVQIVDGPEGPYIQLTKGGEVVQKDLAIVVPARSNAARPQVQVAKITGQNFVRIRVHQGDNFYYAYMEIAH